MLIFLGISYLGALLTSILASNYFKQKNNNENDTNLNLIDYISMILLSPIYLCTESVKWIYRNYPSLKNLLIQFLDIISIKMQILWINVISMVMRLKYKLFVMWMNFMFVATICSLILQKLCSFVFSYVNELIVNLFVPVVDFFVQIIQEITTFVSKVAKYLIEKTGVIINIIFTNVAKIVSEIYNNIIYPTIVYCIAQLQKIAAQFIITITEIFYTHILPMLIKFGEELVKVIDVLCGFFQDVYVFAKINIPIYLDFIYNRIAYPIYHYCLYIPIKSIYNFTYSIYYYIILVPIREICDFMYYQIYDPIVLILKELAIICNGVFERVKMFLSEWIPIIFEKISNGFQRIQVFLNKLIPIIMEKSIQFFNGALVQLMSLVETVKMLWSNIYNYLLYPVFYYFIYYPLIYYPFYVILYQNLYSKFLVVLFNQLTLILSILYDNITVLLSYLYGKFVIITLSLYTDLSNILSPWYGNMCTLWNKIFNSGRLMRLYNQLSVNLANQYNLLCLNVNLAFEKSLQNVNLLVIHMNTLYNEIWNKMQVMYTDLSNKMYEMFIKQKAN